MARSGSPVAFDIQYIIRVLSNDAWDELAHDLVRTKTPRTQCEDQGALTRVIGCLAEYTNVLGGEIWSTDIVINQH